MATRTAKYSFYYAGGRRALCEHCKEPYTYVCGGIKTGTESANSSFADDN